MGLMYVLHAKRSPSLTQCCLLHCHHCHCRRCRRRSSFVVTVRSFLRSFVRSFVRSFLRSFVPSFVPFFVASSFLRAFVPPFAIQCADCYCCAARYLCAFCCTCVTIVLLVVRRSFVRLLCPCVARHSLPSC